MISWIFSSCDSPSRTFLTCCNETFSLYPKLTTSSNAQSSSKEDARIEGSLSVGVSEVVRRTTSERVCRSWKRCQHMKGLVYAVEAWCPCIIVPTAL